MELLSEEVPVAILLHLKPECLCFSVRYDVEFVVLSVLKVPSDGRFAVRHGVPGRGITPAQLYGVGAPPHVYCGPLC